MPKLTEEEKRNRQNLRSKAWRENNKIRWIEYNKSRVMTEEQRLKDALRVKNYFRVRTEFSRLSNICI